MSQSPRGDKKTLPAALAEHVHANSSNPESPENIGALTVGSGAGEATWIMDLDLPGHASVSLRNLRGSTPAMSWDNEAAA